nr:RHS repeat domain-containing protein [Streptomyces actuosus]
MAETDFNGRTLTYTFDAAGRLIARPHGTNSLGCGSFRVGSAISGAGVALLVAGEIEPSMSLSDMEWPVRFEAPLGW